MKYSATIISVILILLVILIVLIVQGKGQIHIHQTIKKAALAPDRRLLPFHSLPPHHHRHRRR